MDRSRWIHTVSRALGWLLLAAVALHYFLDVWVCFGPGPRPPWPIATRFFCLCPVAGLVLGLAMVRSSRMLGTLGLILWLVFPLGSTIQQHFAGYFGFEWALSYQLVALAAVPVALLAGLWDRREAPRMIGIVLVAFGIKGFSNEFVTNHGLWVRFSDGKPMPMSGPVLASRELQVWLTWILGRQFDRWYPWVNIAGIGIGLPLAIATWRLPRRPEPPTP
ncbi:MAG: hypothetical protein JXB39_10515 [Deltaproteobacteria bacterium]|nr:hypothetical protein [Deltaproteobacteria bacterium]